MWVGGAVARMGVEEALAWLGVEEYAAAVGDGA